MAAGLSPREEEVLALVAQGLTNAQVAGRLGLSALTVKKHLERMYEAAGVRNRAELVARAYRRTEPSPAGTGLPAPLTSFVGREREVAEVAALLERRRLVTLAGAGGIGKTRLATAVSNAVAERFAGGVRIVELGAINDPRLVTQAVAAALGVPERPGQRLATLASALRVKEMLLVLDNCEHVIAPSAELVTELLRACPGIRVLATSREALGVPGEVFWPVPPLSLPDLGRSRVVEVAQSEAVRLFVDRASLRIPGFDLSADNARAVAAICRALDGMPLAIELAAARMNALSVHEIRSRLDDRFRELNSDDASITPRHRTLRGVVEWSHQLLTPAEALLFDRLAVFSGGFSLDAVGAVCSGGEIGRDAVLDLLSRLIDKSFVIADLRGAEARYRLLETLHRFGRERLERGGHAGELAGRHAEYFRAMVDQAEPELKGPAQLVWLERLDADHDNLRAALRWSFEHAPVQAARMAAVLWRFWFHRGHRLEGIRWLEQALGVADVPVRMRGRVLNALGNLAAGIDRARSEAMHRENLAIQRSLPDADDWDLTAALSNLGDRLRERGAIAEAKALFLEVLPLRGSDTWGLALTTSQLGHVALDEGDLAQAQARYAAAYRLWRDAGDRIRAAGAVSFAARVAREQGRFARAEQLYRRAMAMHRALGDRYALARELALLSLAVKASGDDGRAARLFAAAVAAHGEFGADLDDESVDGALLSAIRGDPAVQVIMRAGTPSLDDTVDEFVSRRGWAGSAVG